MKKDNLPFHRHDRVEELGTKRLGTIESVQWGEGAKSWISWDDGTSGYQYHNHIKRVSIQEEGK